MPRRAPRLVLLVASAGAVALPIAACGSNRDPRRAAGVPAALLAEARPIGTGPRFQPPASNHLLGSCARHLGPRAGVHVELFAANRVVLLPAGIGTAAPRRMTAGRISEAHCYGALVTLDPTGVVLVRPGSRMTLSSLFRAWGQQLSRSRLASFAAPPGGRVQVFVNGAPWEGSPASVPLTRHAEIVLEVGPHVPPHTSYEFPPGT